MDLLMFLAAMNTAPGIFKDKILELAKAQGYQVRNDMICTANNCVSVREWVSTALVTNLLNPLAEYYKERQKLNSFTFLQYGDNTCWAANAIILYRYHTGWICSSSECYSPEDYGVSSSDSRGTASIEADFFCDLLKKVKLISKNQAKNLRIPDPRANAAAAEIQRFRDAEVARNELEERLSEEKRVRYSFEVYKYYFLRSGFVSGVNLVNWELGDLCFKELGWDKNKDLKSYYILFFFLYWAYGGNEGNFITGQRTSMSTLPMEENWENGWFKEVMGFRVERFSGKKALTKTYLENLFKDKQNCKPIMMNIPYPTLQFKGQQLKNQLNRWKSQDERISHYVLIDDISNGFASVTNTLEAFDNTIINLINNVHNNVLGNFIAKIHLVSVDDLLQGAEALLSLSNTCWVSVIYKA